MMMISSLLINTGGGGEQPLVEKLPYGGGGGGGEQPLGEKLPDGSLELPTPIINIFFKLSLYLRLHLGDIYVIHSGVSRRPIIPPGSPEIWKQLNNKNCWYKCGKKGGLCEDFCGPKGYCCRKGHADCPVLAANVSPTSHHSCVRQGRCALYFRTIVAYRLPTDAIF